MAPNTGRTVNVRTSFNIDDSGGTLRTIPINSISAVGLVFDMVDLTAWQDAIKGALPAHPDAPIEISGPWDTSAAAAAGTLSGSHTILYNLAGATTPLTLDVQFGVRHAWEAGEPQFGLTKTATSGYHVVNYTVDPAAGTYSARAVLFPGSSLPAWGTTAETAG